MQKKIKTIKKIFSAASLLLPVFSFASVAEASQTTSHILGQNLPVVEQVRKQQNSPPQQNSGSGNQSLPAQQTAQQQPAQQQGLGSAAAQQTPLSGQQTSVSAGQAASSAPQGSGQTQTGQLLLQMPLLQMPEVKVELNNQERQLSSPKEVPEDLPDPEPTVTKRPLKKLAANSERPIALNISDLQRTGEQVTQAALSSIGESYKKMFSLISQFNSGYDYKFENYGPEKTRELYQSAAALGAFGMLLATGAIERLLRKLNSVYIEARESLLAKDGRQ